jgi:hypothetical protein
MKQLILASLAGAAALLSTGCENKVGQCNALIKVLNDAQGKIKPAKADPGAFETLAGDLEAAAGEVGKAQVKLPELQKFRDDYKQLLLDTAKGMRVGGRQGRRHREARGRREVDVRDELARRQAHAGHQPVLRRQVTLAASAPPRSTRI